MTEHHDWLDQGIRAAKEGDSQLAQELLTEAIRCNPHSEKAWLWLSAAVESDQAKAHCLRRVLVINPNSQAAQKGLAVLKAGQATFVEPAPLPEEQREVQPPETEPVPTILMAHPAPPSAVETLIVELRPPPISAEEASAPTLVMPGREITDAHTAAQAEAQTKLFWRVVVACLAIVALCLIAAVIYVALNRPSAAREASLADMVPPVMMVARATLRPTFTATPTHTPIPTATTTPTATPTLVPTDTPLPLPTCTATSTDTPVPPPPKRAVLAALAPPVAPTPTPKPKPRTGLPPCAWDPRLDALGVRIEPARVAQGQPHWRLISAVWANEQQAAGKHSIYVEVLGADGKRMVGQPVVFQWADGSITLLVENRPLPDWGTNFPMYATLGSYAASVGGAPSDKVVGMGLGTAEAPAFTVHTTFYLTFQWVGG